MLIKNTIDRLELGAPLIFQNLTMFPLLGEDSHAADYVTLDEALAAGMARVTEVSASGSVPELRFVNTGERQVLLMDGEEVVGAKQNRTLNISILAPAHSELLLPVTCVEAGRWAAASVEFAASPRAHYAAGRARKQAHVSESLRSRGSHAADQGEVWADIAAKSSRMAAHSPTSAMAAMYEQHETGVEAFVNSLPAQPRQRGAVFAVNGGIVGCDLFDCAVTFGKLLPKIIRSYALDAVDAQEAQAHAPVSRETIMAFLTAVSGADAQTFPALGIGEDARLQGEGLTGGALLAEERVAHLSAFAVVTSAAASPSETPLARASARRRSQEQAA